MPGGTRKTHSARETKVGRGGTRADTEGYREAFCQEREQKSGTGWPMCSEP